MKIIHISDLHLGIRLHGRDLSEDQRHILRQAVEMAGKHRPDAFLVAGDIFDKPLPSAEAVQLFDEFIAELKAISPKTHVMLIAGNHDSGQRLDLYRGILSAQGVHIAGTGPKGENGHVEKVTLYDESGPVNFYLLPFVKPSAVKDTTGLDTDGCLLSYDRAVKTLIDREKPDTSVRNVILSHQFYIPDSGAEAVPRAASEVRSVGNIDEVDAGVLESFDYAALGHIHKPWAFDGFHRYSGTPMAYSVDEAGQEKSAVLVELFEKGRRQISLLPFVPLHSVKVLSGTLAELLPYAGDDYVQIKLSCGRDEDVRESVARIYMDFPNVLEIRRMQDARAEYDGAGDPVETDPFVMCRDFLGDMDEEDSALLRDVIDSVKGVAK